MLDIKWIINNPEEFDRQMARRNLIPFIDYTPGEIMALEYKLMTTYQVHHDEFRVLQRQFEKEKDFVMAKFYKDEAEERWELYLLSKKRLGLNPLEWRMQGAK